jgi:6-phosphogluconolactonase (cycloisomerase 2 family)
LRFAVAVDGTVKLLGLTPADQIPWGFTLSPDGRYLIVTAHQGGTLTVYRIGSAGDLTKVASLSCDKGIVDVECRPGRHYQPGH